MKYKNPCKQCLVQPACTAICKERKKYASSLRELESVLNFITLLIGCVGVIILLVLYTLSANHSIFRNSGIIILFTILIVIVVGLTILRINLYIEKENSEYQKMIIMLKSLNGKPMPPPNRIVR